MRLAVDVGIIPRLFVSRSLSATSDLTEEVRYSWALGLPVLLFGRAGEGALAEYFATATLAEFITEQAGETIVQLSDITRLPMPVDRTGDRVDGMTLYELSDEVFSDIVAHGNLETSGLQEAGAVLDLAPPLSVYVAIARQVAERYGSRCSFSGILVSPGEGAAVPIKPRDVGGALHVRQFLFLHEEPANLFNVFAWTVGPDYEIIVDSSRMGADVLSTINPRGTLVLPANRDWWPDETTLAWHRQKFLEHLR